MLECSIMELCSFQILYKSDQFQTGSENDTDTQGMLIKNIFFMFFS